jgi:hypothetical protein
MDRLILIGVVAFLCLLIYRAGKRIGAQGGFAVGRYGPRRR